MKTLVSNHIELVQFLFNEFSSRLWIDRNLLLMGCIEGRLDGKLFNIEFVANEYLNISTYLDTKEVLDEFLPFLKKVMADSEPICSYDVKSPAVVKDEFVSVIEWELLYPQQTLADIMNGRVFNYNARVYNFKCYNPNKVLLRTAYRYNSTKK